MRFEFLMKVMVTLIFNECFRDNKGNGSKERNGNVLFNNALNTFYLRLYGVGHMVKDHSDSERGNLLPPARVLLYVRSHRQDSTYHCLCYTSRGALAGTRNSSMGPPHEGSIPRPIAPWANALTTELHLAPGTEVNTKRILAITDLCQIRLL